MIQLQRL